MPAAFFALFRAAVPFAATIFGGYFLSDLMELFRLRREKEPKPNPLPMIPEVFKRNPAKWKFLGIGAIIMSALIIFITKRLGK